MSLWHRLGFDENPYFTTPIQVDAEGLELFVGRGSEIRRLISKWDEKDRSITVVGGNIGTGKTSFLNVCQYLCLTGKRDFGLTYDPPRLVPAFRKVQLEQEQSVDELLLRIIRATAESIRTASEQDKLDQPTEVKDVCGWLESLSSATSASTGGGVTVLGTGANGLRATSTSHRDPEKLGFDSLLSIFERLARAARGLSSYRGVIVAIDNIEMVETSRVIGLLNDFRDTLFSVTGIWWVLIGQRGLYDLIAADAPRVSQRIKGTETALDGLSWEDFQLAIQIRIAHQRRRTDAVAPIGDELLRALFDASNGEIRYVFKMADEIVTDAIAEHPELTDVPNELAETMLTRSVERQVQGLKLSSREKRVLRTLCEKKTGRPREYKDYGFSNAPHFIQGALQPLQEKGLVSKSTEGNAAMYDPRPLAILAHKYRLLDQPTTAGSKET